jgi:hypothetical protein
MWLFTQYGCFSVVAKREPNGTASKTQIWIRARSVKHLEALRERMNGKWCIDQRDDADYQWRMTVSRKQWFHIADTLAREIDYHNFKNRVLQREGGTRYEHLLHHVWQLVRQWLDEREDDDATTTKR